MICPNCGREISDSARECPGCGAVTHTIRRRRVQGSMADGEQVRVERRVMPEESAVKHKRREGIDGQNHHATSASPVKREKSADERASGSRLPSGLRKQEEKKQGNVRRVRHAPDHLRRKTDARPAMIQPPIHPKSYKRMIFLTFLILCLLAFCISIIVASLLWDERAQLMMAEWGWELAPTDAYATIAENLVDQAYYTKALTPLAVVLEREPMRVDARNLLARCYTELGRIEEAKEIYHSLIEDPNSSGNAVAYRNLIKIYQNEGYNAEALELMKLGVQNVTQTTEFQVMLKEYTPEAPTFSWEEGRYNEEKDLTITVPKGQTVYYSTDGTDPSESGLVYTEGTIIHIPEGKMTVKAIGFTENGTPSEQIEANYTIIIPTPAAPKSNIASGKLKKSVKVSLRPGSEDKKENDKIVAIYYTLDGRQATTEATLYDPNNPIQLPIGKSTLRAISVHENGKVSYEMQVTYEVEGNLKYMFREEDTFKNMQLYSTGYNTFTKNWGKPDSYELLPKEQWYSAEMESYEAVYEWGTARFCIKKAGGNPVLYALDTKNSKMTAPRSTKVGMSGEDVMEKYQDLGQAPLDSAGNRLLYNLNSAGYKFGTYRNEGNGNFAIHYYYPVGENHEVFVELSYYLGKDGNVERIVWQRYMSEL
ncbi:MAG: chitobiase/beta-hexosaminidase C-terminal domain-containing protein [Clostridia bacterium]|nr:chitobiase/beta-hexosaminidase C-terminal domain-containing protein [Clostridia bacterium]